MSYPYPVLDNEHERLLSLQKYNILDTLPEKDFNDIVALAAYICQTPMALVSLVDKHRQWFKARLGIEVEETSRDLSFCAHAIAGNTLFHVPDASVDQRFCDNALVTGSPHIRSYFGMPLVDSSGFSLGTICVLDRKPREMTEEQARALETLGRQVTNQIEMSMQKQKLEAALQEIRRAQHELLSLNAVLENSVEGISRVDSAGHFIAVNSRYAAAFGYTPDQMTGMPWMATIHPDKQDQMRLAFDHMLATGRADIETKGLRKNGALFYKHLTLVPLRDMDKNLAGHYCFLRDITARKTLEHQLQRGAYHDALTDLPNRTSFQETLDHAIGRLQRRQDYSFAVLFIDLDGFKAVNDGYGHSAGDFVLKEAAGRILECIRPGDVAARLGGDEFAVMLDDLANAEHAADAAERIRSSLSLPFFWQNHILTIGASIGISESSIEMKNCEQILGKADAAMYEVKRAGKNGVSVYNSSLGAADETQF